LPTIKMRKPRRCSQLNTEMKDEVEEEILFGSHFNMYSDLFGLPAIPN